jgi:hypothetical protein
MSIQVEAAADGLKAIARGAWSSADTEEMLRRGVTRLEFNQGRGYGARRLPNLDGLESLTELTVVNWSLESIKEIENLRLLESLVLETYAPDAIDFRSFPLLETLRLEWRSGAETIFGLSHLRHLSINGYPFADLDPLRPMTDLEALRIGNAKRLTSASGLVGLAGLRELYFVDAPRLSDIDDVSRSSAPLILLDCNYCAKLGSIDSVRSRSDLRGVLLVDSGRIASLRPLHGLPNLEEVLFYGSTVIEDGDMTPLLSLPRLERVAFQDRREYSHSNAEIERQIRARGGDPESDPLPKWRW